VFAKEKEVSWDNFITSLQGCVELSADTSTAGGSMSTALQKKIG
jgi:hypothetical protein